MDLFIPLADGSRSVLWDYIIRNLFKFIKFQIALFVSEFLDEVDLQNVVDIVCKF